MMYRIQIRKYSSNIIEASTDGKKWIPYIAPLISKLEGDKLVEKLIKQL